MSAYRKDFNETKYMSFLKEDDEVLEKYNEIWEKVKIVIKKELFLSIKNHYIMKNI